MSLVMADEKQNIVQVIREYGRGLFGFIRNRVNTTEDAEDILQEIWFQLSNRSDGETIESISGWLYSVARNRITDSYRKKKNEALYPYEITDNEDWHLTDLLISESNDPETEELKKIFREELTDALDELPESQRNVFIWNELEDITLQEIADRENENLKTIISRKGYAVKHLRKRLENLYKDFINS